MCHAHFGRPSAVAKGRQMTPSSSGWPSLAAGVRQSIRAGSTSVSSGYGSCHQVRKTRPVSIATSSADFIARSRLPSPYWLGVKISVWAVLSAALLAWKAA